MELENESVLVVDASNIILKILSNILLRIVRKFWEYISHYVC